MKSSRAIEIQQSESALEKLMWLALRDVSAMIEWNVNGLQKVPRPLPVLMLDS